MAIPISKIQTHQYQTSFVGWSKWYFPALYSKDKILKNAAEKIQLIPQSINNKKN
jgi:hypothetical protein